MPALLRCLTQTDPSPLCVCMCVFWAFLFLWNALGETLASLLATCLWLHRFTKLTGREAYNYIVDNPRLAMAMITDASTSASVFQVSVALG